MTATVLSPSYLSQRYRSIREFTVALIKSLSAEDCCVQSMPDASPTKWHLGHTSWFFETFVLAPREANFTPYRLEFRVLFNSYYNAVGDKHPRAYRGQLTRPSLGEVLAYRTHVDDRVLSLLSVPNIDRDTLKLIELGIHHEQQHQELLLTDIKHLFSCNPLFPSYQSATPVLTQIESLDWQDYAGGVVEIGHTGEDFCFDNETPRHQVFLQPYQLASRLVTNSEYSEFIAAGAYVDPTFWLSEGWDWRVAQQRKQPLYWRTEGTHWQEFTLNGLNAIDPHQPVMHLSYYEADAYARWAKARLPTEFEWEHAVTSQLGTDKGLIQLFNSAWQWTSSSYAPYPGFHIRSGAVGEYNGKFMVNQYVLRGGSKATPENHSRATYRNFFPASACWQFTGIRLARDV